MSTATFLDFIDQTSSNLPEYLKDQTILITAIFGISVILVLQFIVSIIDTTAKGITKHVTKGVKQTQFACSKKTPLQSKKKQSSDDEDETETEGAFDTISDVNDTDDVDESLLYSNISSINDGGRPDTLTSPSAIKARDLKPNGSHLLVGYYSETGLRPYQEDRYSICEMGVTKEGENVTYFGVFDGHGGAEASSYCCERLALKIKTSKSFPGNLNKALKESFLDIDDEFIATPNSKTSGSTVCICLVFNSDRIVTANAGDSRAIVVASSRVVAMSRDHKPDSPDERKRIEGLGGTVVYWGRWRVESVLAVSRAVGDATLMPYITAEPEVRVHKIVPEDLFLVLASDGIWDVMSNESVGEFLINECVVDGEVKNKLLRLAGRKLCAEAKRLGSGDNLTAVVASLQPKSDIPQ